MNHQLHTLLAIFQQTEYDITRTSAWYNTGNNPSKKIEPQAWSIKLRLIRIVCQALFFLPLVTRLRYALILITPAEVFIRFLIQNKAKMKLRALQKKGLLVLAIAGSYGKTSTKHIIYHTLKKQLSIATTPKSYNTLLGLSEVISKQLDEKTRVFIAELGEYQPGDLKKLLQFVKPDFGVLTQIGPQHLERFEGINGLITEFSDFTIYFQKTKKLLIHESNAQYFDGKFELYGESNKSSYAVQNTVVSRAGTEFVVRVQETNVSTFIPLFGKHQALNSLPSIWLSDQLQLDRHKTLLQFGSLPYIAHRHEPHFAENQVLILDNGYNSNPDSARESIELLSQLPASKRIVITMGFVELGAESSKYHYQFGKLIAAKKIDVLGVIKTPNQEALVRGYIEHGGKEHSVYYGDTQDLTLQALIHEISPNSIVLFENGYQEAYG